MKLTLSTEKGEVLEQYEVDITTDNNEYAYDLTKPLAVQSLANDMKDEINRYFLHGQKA